MNYFAIDENDQFEIAAFQSFFQTEEDIYIDEKELQAVENLSRKQMEGLYYFYRIQFLYTKYYGCSTTGCLPVVDNDNSSHDLL